MPGLGVGLDDLVEASGLLIFVAGAAAAVGGLAAPILAEQVSDDASWRACWWRRRSRSCCSAHAILLGVRVLRGVQSLAIAPFFPLMVAQVARRADASAIGIINAARVGSGFLGPLVATSLLATGSPGLLYAVLGGAGIAAVLLFRRR